MTITADVLLAGSVGDALPEAAAPQDEANQVVGIVAIAADGVSLTAANVAATVFPVDTTHGQIDAATFDANGRLIQLVYTPGTDFVSGDIAGSPILDSFGFTVADDGVVIPDLGGPNVQLLPASTDEVASVFVIPVNDPPALAEIADLVVAEDSDLQTLELSGIAAGGNEQQDLRVTATSSDTTLFADPIVTYTTGDIGGFLDFTPIADRYGTSTVTVTIEDAGLDNNLESADDNSFSIRTFEVTISPQNDVPETTDKSFQTGEDLPLTITAEELYADSVGDSDPLALSPQDESNQLFRITSIETESDSVTPANADSGPFATARGQIDSVRFDSEGFLIDLVYTPAADFNSTDTPRDQASSELSDPVLDAFRFTLEDDGLAVDPEGGPDLVTPAESSLGSASILVTAINDQPEMDDIEDQLIDEGSSEQTVILRGINPGGNETQLLRITAVRSNSTLLANPRLTHTQGESEATLRFTPNPDRFGSSTISVTLTDSGPDNILNTTDDNALIVKTFEVTVRSVNSSPSFAPLLPLSLVEGGGAEVVSLTAIDAGANENQGLSISAESDNPSLIANPTVDYDGIDSVGSLTFAPLPDQFGSATITVTLTDAGEDNDLSTPDDNASFERAFVVDVLPVDDLPLISPIDDLEVNENDPEVLVALEGISPGPSESQEIRVTAVSDNATLISDPVVTYSSPDATGELRFSPQDGQFGTAVVTVLIEDSGLDGDLATSADNLTSTETFMVTVNFVNDLPTLDPIEDQPTTEDSETVSVDLKGISAGPSESQPLRITATSSDTTLIADPVVSYFSPAAEGQLDFTPEANQFGSATITVAVEDGGEDGNFDTASDNLTATQSFTVNVASDNDLPIARDDSAISKRNLDSTTILPLSNDDDIDGTLDINSLVITQAPAFGTVTQHINASGQLELIYSPSELFTNGDSLEYTISDDGGATSLPAVVQIVPDPSPLVGGDFGGGVAADGINIDVLENDVAVSGQLDLATLTIVQEPSNGTTTIESDNTITYSPTAGYVGPDSFTYTVADTDGNVSAPVTVNLKLVASGFHNPRDPYDVNASGDVTALDALIILNRIKLSGSSTVTVNADDRGPNFFDVDDSQTVSSLDAFLVLGRIEGDSSDSEGESFGATSAVVNPVSIDPSTFYRSPVESSVDESLNTPVHSSPLEIAAVRSKLADRDLPSDHPVDDGVVSLLANDSSRDESEVEESEALTDLALASLT